MTARGAWALACKEVEQHALVVVGALLLLALVTFVTVVVALDQHAPSLLASGHGVVAIGVPMLAVLLAERLVVQDHGAGTHEFLAALPVSPALRTSVRYLLGLGIVAIAVVAVVLGTALVASRREGVPPGYVLLLLGVLGLYGAVWHAVAFAVAHTGRWRWLLWWCFFTVEETVGVRTPGWHAWFGLVGDGADRARLAPPWEHVPVGVAWLLAAVAFAFAVASWRGGWLVERWFRPAPAEAQGRLVALGIAVTVAVGTLDGLVPRPDPWQPLPPAHEGRHVTVRAAASPDSPARATAVAAGEALDALGDAVGADFPDLVVLRGHPEPGEARIGPPRGTTGAEPACVVLVDPSLPADDAVEGILAVALGCAMSGIPDVDPDARGLAEGLARWWGPGSRARLGALAALGAGHAGEDFHATAAAVGPDVAGAVAWAGLVALEELAGREAVLALGSELLDRSPRFRAAWLGVRPSWRRTPPGWVGARTGVDEAAWRALHEEVLARAPRPEVPPMPRVDVDVVDGEVRATWPGEWPAGAVIEWLALDPLRAAPLPSDAPERAVPIDGRTTLAISTNVHGAVVARAVLEVPGLGRLAGPWSPR